MADLANLDDVTEAMKDVIDPELGINVIDLGLVYDMRVDENNVAIKELQMNLVYCMLVCLKTTLLETIFANLLVAIKLLSNSVLKIVLSERMQFTNCV